MPQKLFLALLLTGCTGSALDSGGGSYADAESQSTGFIFKGPMNAGSTITVQALDDSLSPTGDVVEVSVEDDSGAFTADLPFQGPVLVTAVGSTFDEAYGEVVEVPLALSAYVYIDGGEVDLNVNLITDLAVPLVERLVEDGVPAAEAISSAETDVLNVIPLGGAAPDLPEGDAAGLSPYSDSYESGWLFAFSAVTARAGRDLEEQGIGDLPTLMSGIKGALAETGEVDQTSLDILYTAEERTNPDLAVLTLTKRLSAINDELTIADMHLALDSDHDRVLNIDDNCRYASNPDQEASDAGPFGTACDLRLSDISASETIGCGIIAASGDLRCWSVDGETIGGAPPHPDSYPTATVDVDALGLSGVHVDVSVEGDTVCAVAEDGALRCAFGGEASTGPLGADIERVEASADGACAQGFDGGVTCFDADGSVTISQPGPFVDFALLGADAFCGVAEADGAVICFDGGGALSLDGLPAEAAAIAGTGEVEAACAITTDGSVACFGSDALSGAPTGTGFVEVALSGERACAVDADGARTCWEDASVCDLPTEPEYGVEGLDIGGCYTCGITEVGFGDCWPRLIDAPASPERGG